MLPTALFTSVVLPTFDSPKVAKARLPLPFFSVEAKGFAYFFVPGDDILNDRLVTFCTAVGPMFIRKW